MVVVGCETLKVVCSQYPDRVGDLLPEHIQSILDQSLVVSLLVLAGVSVLWHGLLYMLNLVPICRK